MGETPPAPPEPTPAEPTCYCGEPIEPVTGWRHTTDVDHPAPALPRPPAPSGPVVPQDPDLVDTWAHQFGVAVGRFFSGPEPGQDDYHDSARRQMFAVYEAWCQAGRPNDGSVS